MLGEEEDGVQLLPTMLPIEAPPVHVTMFILLSRASFDRALQDFLPFGSKVYVGKNSSEGCSRPAYSEVPGSSLGTNDLLSGQE